MRALERVCVFCGSSPGRDPAYLHAAGALGSALARRGVTLIYGGGSLGLMGAVADRALSDSGKVVGVITRQLLDKEVAHGRLSDLRVVDTMHERKKMMADLADGFIALPGGLGTLDELFEIVTWAQLRLHASPVGILNVGGFYDGLLGFLDRVRTDGFLRLDLERAVHVHSDPERLLDAMIAHRPAEVRDWQRVPPAAP
ncbi:MAG: TIGR00730 family Rossman fold protein [Phycisphaerae bacterium]|nr:TIGR00730 family Rossman fold protein [Phycisphaerae bacterium]